MCPTVGRDCCQVAQEPERPGNENIILYTRIARRDDWASRSAIIDSQDLGSLSTRALSEEAFTMLQSLSTCTEMPAALMRISM